MSVTQYIGARYVPIMADPIEWSNSNSYEPLTIVIHEGNSYTSRQYVPVGIGIDNDDFWALTGNYNAQIEQYRQEVQAFADDIEGIQNEIGEGFDSVNTVAHAIDNVSNNLDSEISNRESADENLYNTLNNSINSKFPVVTNDIADNAITDKKITNHTIEQVKLADNFINGLYIEPELLGDYTAFSGKYITSNANADNPFKPQAFCYKKDNVMMQLLINNAENQMRYVTMNTDNNSVAINTTNRTGFGHANQMEYVPSKNQYYINDGLGHILVCNASFSTIDSVNVPSHDWVVFVYDRKRNKAYVVDYYGAMYSYNLSNNTLTLLDYSLDTPVQSGSVTVQGAACYDGILVFSISKRPSGLICYDIDNGEYLGTITINQNGDEIYPISEIEDISFDNDGNAYFACATVLSSELYCYVSTIWKCNIFKGLPVTPWWSISTEKHDVYVECSNYNGFKSDGSSAYPFKSLESLMIHAQHASDKIKTIYMGTNSTHSTDTTQTWYGFLYFTSINIHIRFNSHNNITICGTLEFRNGCNAWLLNRAILKPAYNTNKNFLFRVENATVFAQTVQGLTGYTDIDTIVVCSFTVMLIINAIVNDGNFTNELRENQIHGYGYNINVNPKKLNGSWN